MAEVVRANLKEYLGRLTTRDLAESVENVVCRVSANLVAVSVATDPLFSGVVMLPFAPSPDAPPRCPRSRDGDELHEHQPRCVAAVRRSGMEDQGVHEDDVARPAREFDYAKIHAARRHSVIHESLFALASSTRAQVS